MSFIKFCANLGFMFTESSSLLERYALAKDAGFKVVETIFPFGFTIEQVTAAKTKAGVDQVLINLYTGDTSKGEMGVTYKPGKEEEFRKNLKLTIEYAKALKCSKLHVMAGVVDEEITDAHWRTFESNLSYAAEQLKKEGIVGVIEPINKYSVPNYFLNSYEKAIEIIERINSPNIRLMMDLFHMQHIKGDLSNSIKRFMPYVGHIQIAQVPNRNEPDTSGELNYKYILNLLVDMGYNDYIGLEYKPLNGSKEGLKWIKEYGYTL